MTNRNYSMLGPDAQRAVETGLAAADWYHTEIPRNEMKALMKRQDQPAIRDTFILFGVMIISAAIGVAIVVVNFVLGGYVLATAAAVSLTLYHAAALFGFFVRLGLITLTMVLVVSVTDIDRVAMGISAVVSYLVLLSLEAVAVARGAEREYEWSN